MPRVKKDKKIPLLESSYEEILVCKKSNFKPQIEIFIQKPENISQQNLGTLAGILEIDDESEDSSYIVNYLVSVIKKEYYSKEKRGPIESFEAALHKANLALAKIAEHGNTEWLGKINAIIAIIEKNNIHISQTGKVKALLLRDKSLTNISEGTTEQEFPSPLKTFVDVLSGRLEKNDKIMITTEDIFKIFSFEEIKRSALKFSHPEFIQFLKTALVNELDKASLLVIQTKEKEIIEKAPVPPKSTSKLNAFSQTSFSKAPKSIPVKEDITSHEKQNIINDVREDIKKESGEFVDKKTGHIYIKEGSFLKDKESALDNFLENGRAKMNSLRKNISSVEWKKVLPKTKERNTERKSRIAQPTEKIERVKIRRNIKPYLEKIAEKTSILSSKASASTQNVLKISFLQTKKISAIASEKSIFWTKNIFSNSKKISYLTFIFLSKKSNLLIEKIKILLEKAKTRENFYPKKEFAIPTEKTTVNIKNTFLTFIEKISSILLPRLSKIKNIFFNLSNKQKIYAISLILLLFVVPYIIVKFQNKEKETVTLPQETVMAIQVPLENDKNVSSVKNIIETTLEKNALKIVNLNDKIFVITENAIIDIQDNSKYELPENFIEIKTATNMDDLNLIFLSNNKNELLSWSPVSKKFQENQINLPEKIELFSQKTYLTYLYILDKENAQIYRYPRGGTGFSDKSNWLKDTLDFNQISDMAVGENIFLVINGDISMFSKGRKQSFEIEPTATRIKATKLYTKKDSEYIYVLDKDNARVIKLSLEGKIISQFYNSEISQANDLEVNEKNNTVFFSSKNKVFHFEM